ncbi:MAG: secondary thiamine-phosphate synthase enzyme YjbQ [bacterium]|nr:secondary thiamine-phosphate synthase enzyme YjbQ [bacterium]
MTYAEKLTLETEGFCHVVDISAPVAEATGRSGIAAGLVTVFCPGSTGSITTIEYESGVIADLKRALERLVPQEMAYDHDKRWGDGNGFSHVRAALMKPSLTVPLVRGELTLGTWQQIVFINFDNKARQRHVVVQVTGDS